MKTEGRWNKMSDNIVIPFNLQDHPNLEDLIDFHREHTNAICDHFHRGPVFDYFNFQLDDELLSPQLLSDRVYQPNRSCILASPHMFVSQHPNTFQKRNPLRSLCWVY